MNNKIAIIIPYFGHFPKWMSLFVEGCKHNPFIDFFLYTDCEYHYECSNLFYISISFRDFCDKIGKSLGITFEPKSAYKLCGVRPFYGYIFKGELTKYDYWGFCDIDLVFGNLKIVFSDDVLGKYDVISTEGDRISGPLCILRNNRKNREICFRIKQWQQMLQSVDMIPLDEKYLSDVLAPELKILRGINSYMLRRVFPLWIAKRINDVLAWPIQHFSKLFRRQYYQELNATPEIGVHSMSYIYREGKLSSLSDNKEIPYLHFLFFKKNMYRASYLWDDTTPLDTSNLKYDHNVFIDETGIHN